MKKLRDWSIFSKMKQWLLLDGDKIIWVCGRRISDDIKVTSRTTKFAKFIFILIVLKIIKFRLNHQ